MLLTSRRLIFPAMSLPFFTFFFFLLFSAKLLVLMRFIAQQKYISGEILFFEYLVLRMAQLFCVLLLCFFFCFHRAGVGKVRPTDTSRNINSQRVSQAEDDFFFFF